MMYTVIVRWVSHRIDDPHKVERWQGPWTRALGKHQHTADEQYVHRIARKITEWEPSVYDSECFHYQARVVPADVAEKVGPPRPEMRQRLEDHGVLTHDPGPAGRINYKGAGK